MAQPRSIHSGFGVPPHPARGGNAAPRAQQPANESLYLISALQVTLNVEELIGIFFSEIQHYIAVDAVTYHDDERGLNIEIETMARHRCSYGLTLMQQDLGTLVFSRKKRFAEQELAVLETLVAILLYPLKNCLNYYTALKAAQYDPLTGVLNRASFEQHLPRELERAARDDQDLTLLVLDLDHFKSINDNYGHLIGDDVLRHVATVIKSSLRGADLFFRYGGEEFVAVLHSSTAELASIVTERIHKNLEQNPYLLQNGDSQGPVNITVSIGVAGFQPEDTPETLFEKADKAAYRAKVLGRNRTVKYEP